MTGKKTFFLFLFLVGVVFVTLFIQSADRETIENELEREKEKELAINPQISPILSGCPIQKEMASRGLIAREAWEGVASWYGKYFHGRITANGETYNMWALTAAHKELAFGTVVRVTHLVNGKSVDVRINDRGPFIEGRIIDLSMQAAREIGMKEEGIVDVKIELIFSP